MKTAVSESEVSSENGSEQPVTSPPAASAAVAGGDARAQTVTQMMRLLRDTRRQISELRQRTVDALAFVRQVSTDRRQELEEIRSARAQLNLIFSQLANAAVADNNDTAASNQRLPGESDSSAST